jgi:argininosuccinate lyase
MAERSHADFLTVTELADNLVRRGGVSFREAHNLVSAAVKALNGPLFPRSVEAVKSLAPFLTASRAELLEALDPRHFIDIRRIPEAPPPKRFSPRSTKPKPTSPKPTPGLKRRPR